MSVTIASMRPRRVEGRLGLVVLLQVRPGRGFTDHPALQTLCITGPPEVVLAHAAAVRAGARPDSMPDAVDIVWWRCQWRTAKTLLVAAVCQLLIVGLVVALAVLDVGSGPSWVSGLLAGGVVGAACGAVHDVVTCTPRWPRRYR